MAKIAISYRRSDSRATVGRIFDRLAGHYGKKEIFLDIDAIPYGANLKDRIDSVLNEVAVLVVVVGAHWVGPRVDGPPRIFDEMDTVSLEVQTALARRMPIIPVLVDDAVMPRPGELPQRLQEFSFINALKIDSGVDFNIHIGRLIEALDQILGRYTISSRADVGGHQRKIGSLPSTRVHGMVASQRSKFSRIAIIYISASVGMIWLAHYLIVIKLNLNFGYMRLATVIVSAACGFLLSWRYRCSWPSAVLISAVVAVTAVTGMVFTVAFIDRAPFVPSSIFEWQEIMEVLVLIILSTGAGNLVAAWCLLVKLRKHRRTGT